MDELKPELEKQVDRLREPFFGFIGAQTTASALLLIALVAALMIANSPYAGELKAIQHFSLRLGFGDHTFYCMVQPVRHCGSQSCSRVFTRASPA